MFSHPIVTLSPSLHVILKERSDWRISLGQAPWRI